jgi:hypothetical protein
MINQKRAVSHIEMAVSFGIFAMFTLWLMIYLNPIRNQDISNVLIDTVEDAIIQNTTISLLEAPVSAQASSFCFKINNTFGTTDRTKIFLRDANDKVLKFDIPDPQNISIETSGNFYHLYYADAQFTSPSLGGMPCLSLNSSQYNYTSTRMDSPLLLSRLTILKQLYDTEYNELKEELHFPVNSDFSIVINNLVTQQVVIQMQTSKPKKVEILAREIPVEIIYSDGEIIKAIMNIQAW